MLSPRISHCALTICCFRLNPTTVHYWSMKITLLLVLCFPSCISTFIVIMMYWDIILQKACNNELAAVLWTPVCAMKECIYSRQESLNEWPLRRIFHLIQKRQIKCSRCVRLWNLSFCSPYLDIMMKTSKHCCIWDIIFYFLTFSIISTKVSDALYHSVSYSNMHWPFCTVLPPVFECCLYQVEYTVKCG